ncbi:MAG: gliding motility-associated C-terminal domain-containing protein [Chitinophagales bacterium]
MRKCCLVFTILITTITRGYSQPCTTLGQTPSTAFPICGTTSFTQNNVPICGGTLIPTTCGNGTYLDVNPFYYRFHCFTSGTLAFILDPINNNDDYDWVLFDITGRNPNEVYTDITLNVAENWSAITGNTGAAAVPNPLRNCAGNTPNFSRTPGILGAHEYLLMVSNWSASQQGYTLTFGGGTAVIADPVSPAIASANVDCGGQQVNILFNKKMKCNSLAADRSDFILSPANGTLSAITGFGCLSSFDMDSINITFNAPLPPGTYTLSMANGTDGSTLLDNCGTPIPVGDNISFTVPQRAPIPGPVSVTANPANDCTPIQVTVLFPQAVECASAALNGSDFLVTGPSPVTVTAVIPVCNSGQTNGFTIQFTAPITVAGTYTVTIVTGTDGNSIVGTCNREVQTGSTAQFTVAAQAPIPMGIVTIGQCSPTSLTLTFADPILCNTVSANGSDFAITGPSTVAVTGATTVNCINGVTNTITLQFASPISVPGNYQVQAITGTDGNTLLGQCKLVPAGNSSLFTLSAQPTIAMGTVIPPSCTPSSITLTFTEPIVCSSIAANGTDFIISGPSAVIVSSAAAVNCNANGETTTITIQLSASILATGNYTVQITSGSDGNTLLGQCNRQATAGSNTQFILAAQPPLPMGTIPAPPCTPQSITLTFADRILCNSIAANGSDFIITGPSAVTVSSAIAVNCNANGETNIITIQLTAAILASGNYTLQIANGTDGNTLIGQCNRQVTAGSNTQFALAPQPSIPMGTIPPPNCSPSIITLNFTDNILCSSIATNGSDFIITGPAAVAITGATGTCNANGETNSITIQLSAPIIVSGNFQVQMAAGNDGNTLIGNCNRRTTAGESAMFTIPPASPVPMDNLVPIACSPASLKLIFPASIRCSSIASNGSDFIVTGPSAITVASAAGTCDANGLTTSIDIQLASPIVTAGSYQVRLVNGSDGNTLLSDCNRQTPVGSFINFNASDTVSAEFQYQIQYDCETDVITFSHDGQHSVNQWTWTVNGASAGTAQTITQSFSAASQNQVQLIVSNGVCNDTYSTSIVLNNKVTVDFDLPESVCPEDTVIFRNLSTGQIDSWQWTFGNGNTSTVQSPPAQIYPITGTETLYTVSLTAGSNNGCSATATKTLKVLSACIIAVPSAFTPNNDGKNDYLYPLNALKAENLDFKIFNRWGQLMFHSKDWRKQWDGRTGGIMQATGVYVWMLYFTHKDTRKKYSMKGTTTLIR